MKSYISSFIQILGFAILIGFFSNLYQERTGEISSPHILKGASLYRDSNGIPNIQADTFQDGFFALGFAHAEDRLWQMYITAKLSKGQLSEVFGDKTLEFDKFTKMLNLQRACVLTFDSFTKDEKSQIEAYVNGINHYIDTTSVLPIEFLILNVPRFKWTIVDSCLSIKLIEYYLSTDFLKEIIREYLLNTKIIPQETIEKIFPFEINHFESQATIIKQGEAMQLKKNSTKKDAEKVVINERETQPGTDTNDTKKKIEKKKVNVQHTKQDIHGGSNSYVFSGKITEDGQPILGNDPHLHTAMPAFWYVINLKIKETGYHFIGATHPGSSSLFIGENGFFSWGITIGFADIADFIKLPKSIVNTKHEYKLNNHVHTLRPRTETIYLNIQRTIGKSVSYLDSEIGPIINGYEDSLFEAIDLKAIPHLLDENYYYILRASFTNQYDSNFKALALIHMVNDMPTMKKALSQISMSLSIIYSDKKGNIGYQLTGKIPLRKNIGEGSYPMIIKEESDLISKLIPFEEMPHIENPDRGYIVTCNNLIISQDYMHILQGGFNADQRARVIEQAIDKHLKEGKKITTKFIIDKILDNVLDLLCVEILTLISSLYKKANREQKTQVFSYLKGFNCEIQGESKKAMIYNVFTNEIYLNLFYYKGENNEVVSLLTMESEERSNYFIYKLKQYNSDPKKCIEEYGKSCTDFFDDVSLKTLTRIKDLLGNNEKHWKWNNLNKKYYPHLPFSDIPFLDMISSPIVYTDGNTFTAKVSGSHITDHKYISMISSNLKYITHMNNPHDLYISLDCGNSGRLFTKHYDDRCYLHEKNKMIHFNSQFKDKATLLFNSIKQ